MTRERREDRKVRDCKISETLELICTCKVGALAIIFDISIDGWGYKRALVVYIKV